MKDARGHGSNGRDGSGGDWIDKTEPTKTLQDIRAGIAAQSHDFTGQIKQAAETANSGEQHVMDIAEQHSIPTDHLAAFRQLSGQPSGSERGRFGSIWASRLNRNG